MHCVGTSGVYLEPAYIPERKRIMRIQNSRIRRKFMKPSHRVEEEKNERFAFGNSSNHKYLIFHA